MAVEVGRGRGRGGGLGADRGGLPQHLQPLRRNPIGVGGAIRALGDFRAGLMATWFGAVPAVLIGGLGAMAVTLLWMRLFPELPKIDKLTNDQ